MIRNEEPVPHLLRPLFLTPAFEWDPGWAFLGAYFDCLPGQLTTTIPAAPGGSDAGTVTTVFDCMQSTQLVTIGRLVMMAGSSGCLRQVVSSHPNGTHAVDCLIGVDFISESSRLGRICVTAGGEITCGLDADPVEPTTWGQVKATYR